MKHTTYSTLLLINMCITGAMLYASDLNMSKFTFDTYDKELFSNTSTNTVELVYTTPFVESASQQSVTIEKIALKQLIYRALARLAYTEQMLEDRRSSYYAICRSRSLKDTEKAFTLLDTCVQRVNNTYSNLKKIEKVIDETTDKSVILTHHDVLFVVQHMYGIVRERLGAFIFLDSSKKATLTLSCYKMLSDFMYNYRDYEQR